MRFHIETRFNDGKGNAPGFEVDLREEILMDAIEGEIFDVDDSLNSSAIPVGATVTITRVA